MVRVQVDAALDLSHTQNIGRMIKAHFPYSQFIVVSLKEGMFSNANVIFRTKFVDGVSTVTRTLNERRCAARSWFAACRRQMHACMRVLCATHACHSTSTMGLSLACP